MCEMNDLDIMADSASMTREEMNVLYSPSRWCQRMSPDLIVDYHCNLALTVSEKVKRSLRCQLDVSYGPSERQKYDIITSDSTLQDAPVVIYLHGGYWQACSKEHGSFLAETVVRSGAVFVSVGYDLCPQVSMTHIVDQVRRALDSIHAMAISRRSSGIYLAGHSAGAHLAIMALLSSQSNFHLVQGLFLLSGVFDLRPLLETNENVVLKMTVDEAWNLSPINSDNITALNHKYPQARVVTVAAEFDSPAFKQQARAYTEALKSAGQNADNTVVAGVDHFDLVERLTDSDYSLSQMLTAIIVDSKLRTHSTGHFLLYGFQ